MKKAFKIAGVVLTAVFYSIAVFLLTENANLHFSSVSETQSSDSQILFEVTPSAIFGIPLTQETSFNLFSAAKYSNSNFQHKPFTACLKYAEKTLSSEFVQYVFQAQNFPVKLRKADLLFPFHYFW